MMASVRVMLTGATGFLGLSVTRVLAEHGHELHFLLRRTSRADLISQYAARIYTLEITDPVALNAAAVGMDAIVHLAADLSHWSHHRDRIYRTNVVGTRVVAEAAKTVGIPRVLHVSSIAAVGYSADGNPVDESAPNNFVPLELLYHESKRLAEEEAFDARRYGVSVTVVNPGVLYGPRPLTHTFGHTMLELAAGKVPGHPTGGLSIADVEDVAAAFPAALERGRDGERYILAGANVTYREAFERQAAAAGATYAGRALPAWFLAAAARAFELRSRFSGIEPRLTIDNATIAPLRMWYDSGKAARELGYAPRPLEATLERMAAAYREAGLLPR